MLSSCLQVIYPGLGLLINVSVQVLSYKYIKRIGLLKSILFGFFSGFSSTIFLELNNSDSMSIIITNVISYSALGYCYFHFINLGETARRIRILRELYNIREGLSMDELLERYNAQEVVVKRVNRLLNNGQIICKDEKYYIGSPTVLFMAKTITMMKAVLLRRKSEFN